MSKQFYTATLAILMGLTLLAACTPAEQQTAAVIQGDISAVTPAATVVVDTALAATGNAAAVPLNNALSAGIQTGQVAIQKQLQTQAPASPAAATAPVASPAAVAPAATPVTPTPAATVAPQ